MTRKQTETTEQAPYIDYLSKDYASFRQLMLSRLRQRVPGWLEDKAADLGHVLVEALAYSADYVSYFQDAVASEAYLGTARLRRSVRRHARLLDYVLHEGCNARLWVHIQVRQELFLPTGTQLCTKLEGVGTVLDLEDSAYQAGKQQQAPIVFELMEPAHLHPLCNAFDFDLPDDRKSLAAGATAATLRSRTTEQPPPLRAGDIVIFVEQLDPNDHFRPQRDPKRRHAVRLTRCDWAKGANNHWQAEIKWSQYDTLPFSLPVGYHQEKPIAVALGNIVLADQGETQEGEVLAQVKSGGRYRPQLRLNNITICEPIDPLAAPHLAASQMLRQHPDKALPAIQLTETGQPLTVDGDHQNRTLITVSSQKGEQNEEVLVGTAELRWQIRRDLLDSSSLARTYTAEMERNGEAQLRFGFGGRGRKPVAGATFNAVYRLGNGPEGNIGADTLGHVILGKALFQKAAAHISAVSNPLPAVGGTHAEALERARLHAPHAHKQRRSCVTAADYAERALEHPDVKQAVARIRPLGSVSNVYLYVLRQSQPDHDPVFLQELGMMLEQYRLLNHVITIRTPVYAGLRIELDIQVQRGHHGSTVRQELEYVLGSESYGSVRKKGFFHPDHFTFGQPVYQSQVIACAMAVAGVRRVTVKRFGRLYDEGANETVVAMGALEIARFNAPSMNLLLHVEGGL